MISRFVISWRALTVLTSSSFCEFFSKVFSTSLMFFAFFVFCTSLIFLLFLNFVADRASMPLIKSLKSIQSSSPSSLINMNDLSSFSCRTNSKKRIKFLTKNIRSILLSSIIVKIIASFIIHVLTDFLDSKIFNLFCWLRILVNSHLVNTFINNEILFFVIIIFDIICAVELFCQIWNCICLHFSDVFIFVRTLIFDDIFNIGFVYTSRSHIKRLFFFANNRLSHISFSRNLYLRLPPRKNYLYFHSFFYYHVRFLNQTQYLLTQSFCDYTLLTQSSRDYAFLQKSRQESFSRRWIAF